MSEGNVKDRISAWQRNLCVALCLMVALAAVTGAQDQKPARPDLPKLFEKKEVMIQMRDGVKLHTEIYTPRDAQEPLPMLMEQ